MNPTIQPVITPAPPAALFAPDRNALLMKWRDLVAFCRDVSQWTTDSEVAWLAEACAGREVVGEVGSYKGKTARAMSHSCDGEVHCIDRFQDGTREDFERNLAREIRWGFVKLHAMESEDGARMIAGGGIRFELFFIDASHTKEDVLRDIALWKPLMRPGGILCGHDYCPEDGAVNGVSAAVREALPGHCRPIDSIWAIQT